MQEELLPYPGPLGHLSTQVSSSPDPGGQASGPSWLPVVMTTARIVAAPLPCLSSTFYGLGLGRGFHCLWLSCSLRKMAVDGVWGNGSSQRSVEAVRRALGWWYTMGLGRASQCGESAAAADLVAPAVPPLCSAVDRARLLLPGHSSVQNRHGTWRGNLGGGYQGPGEQRLRDRGWTSPFLLEGPQCFRGMLGLCGVPLSLCEQRRLW